MDRPVQTGKPSVGPQLVPTMALDTLNLVDLGAELLASSEAGRKLADLSRVLAPAQEEAAA